MAVGLIVLAMSGTGCSSTGTESVPATTAETIPTTAATTTTVPNPLPVACAVVIDGFEPLILKQLQVIDLYEEYAQGPTWDGSLEAWRDTNRRLLQGLIDDSDAVVLGAAKLVNEGNPHGDALLAYAITSRMIAIQILEGPSTAGRFDPAQFVDDEDEFHAFEVVRARCEALGS